MGAISLVFLKISTIKAKTTTNLEMEKLLWFLYSYSSHSQMKKETPGKLHGLTTGTCLVNWKPILDFWSPDFQFSFHNKTVISRERMLGQSAFSTEALGNKRLSIAKFHSYFRNLKICFYQNKIANFNPFQFYKVLTLKFKYLKDTRSWG